MAFAEEGRGREGEGDAPEPEQDGEGSPLGGVDPLVGGHVPVGAVPDPREVAVGVHGDQEADGLRADEDREHRERHGCEAEAARD